MAQAQTTVYTTGQTYADAWTGWSTPVVTNVTSSSVNGVNIYTFNGTNGNAYTIETYRQFTINSNDLDFYLAATAQNTVVSIEYSQDNISYTSIGSLAYGAGFSYSSLVLPTYDPVVTTFYIKLKMVGTFGSAGQALFNNLRIDAVLNSTNAVSIAPVALQNILVGVNGNTLTASESPSSATSREWKYSTTSGSGYVAFGTPQTGTTYTPNFAAAGVYYVVCESNFSGDVQVSNEVEINVGTASVDEFKLGSTVIFNHGLLQIFSAIPDYQVQIFDLTGKLIVAEQNLKTYQFDSQIPGIYFVTFTMNNDRRTLKIVHAG